MSEKQPEKVTAVNQPDAQEIELELKKLEIMERKLNLRDLEERLAERELKREAKGSKAKSNARDIADADIQQARREAGCNHRKGGEGYEGYLGQGTDAADHAIHRHRMPNGDIWIRCLRCAKTWKPPVLSLFTDKAGVIDKPGYAQAMDEYRAGLMLPTRNKMSESAQFRWTVTDKDGNQHDATQETFREATKHSNMR